MSNGLPDERTREHGAAERAVEIIGVDTCYAAYSNIAQVSATPFDIQIVFAEVVEVTGEKLKARSVARIILSPEHAMAVLRVLGQNIKTFEAQFGRIRRKTDVADSDGGQTPLEQ